MIPAAPDTSSIRKSCPFPGQREIVSAMALVIFLLVAGLALGPADVFAQPTGLREWCTYGDHSSSEACRSANSTCQVIQIADSEIAS